MDFKESLSLIFENKKDVFPFMLKQIEKIKFYGKDSKFALPHKNILFQLAKFSEDYFSLLYKNKELDSFIEKAGYTIKKNYEIDEVYYNCFIREGNSFISVSYYILSSEGEKIDYVIIESFAEFFANTYLWCLEKKEG